MTDQKQRVVLNGESSPWLEVFGGVPQGSVLTLLCFLVYVNDNVEIVSGSIKLYADDAKAGVRSRGGAVLTPIPAPTLGS